MNFNWIVKPVVLALSVLLSLIFSSCTKEDHNEASGSFVLTLALQGSEGGFTYYPVQFDDVMTGTLSALGQSIAQPGYYTYTQIDNTIYATGGLGNNDLHAIVKNADGQLVKRSANVVFTNGLSDLLKVDDQTLLAIEMATSSDMLTFHKINSQSLNVTQTSRIPVSQISRVAAPSFSGAVLSDNLLYVSFYISDPNTWATNHTDSAQIAVFNYLELTLQKVINDPITGPIGGFGTKSGLIKDEKGDIYALSHSNPANGFSQTTKPGAIVRIKKGTTQFDTSYRFNMESVTGGFNTAHLMYLGNGKVFSTINMAKNKDQGRWSDSPLKPAIIDLYNQTVRFIEGVPLHSGTGRKLADTALRDGKYVYICVPEQTNIYIYKIDTENFTATKGALVEANFVAGFFKL